MTGIAELVHALYAALAAGDEEHLRILLADDFVGHFCAGMPAGAGVAVGVQAAKEHWWAIGAAFAVQPAVEELLPCVDGRLVVRGTYRGRARAGGHPVRADFVHVWTAARGRLIELRQITDTARWGTG